MAFFRETVREWLQRLEDLITGLRSDVDDLEAGAGTGDFNGPVTSTDNAVVRFDGTDGSTGQNSLVTISDAGSISLPSAQTVDGRDVSADGAALDAAVITVAANSAAISSLQAIDASRRDAIWDPPTVAGANDEEFTSDPLVSQAVWTLSQEGGASAMIRDGAISLTTAVASGHFRSSVIGSALYVQIRANEACVLWRTVAAALSVDSIWFAGMGCLTENASGVTNNPKMGLAMFKNSAGGPDYQNAARIRTGTNGDRLELITHIANVLTTNVVGATTVGHPYQLDGLAIRVNATSSASGNFGGFSWRRNGSIATMPPGQSAQYNSASDKVGFYLHSNPTNGVTATVATVSNTIFAIHFLRAVPAASGWLAQS